jgi:hypothetical protein
MKEAEILASNLGEGGISAHEILSDVGQLKALAQLQESMASLVTLVLIHYEEQYAVPSGPYTYYIPVYTTMYVYALCTTIHSAGVYSASNRNEYQKHKNNVSRE